MVGLLACSGLEAGWLFIVCSTEWAVSKADTAVMHRSSVTYLQLVTGHLRVGMLYQCMFSSLEM